MVSEKRFIFATNEKWFLFDNETEDYMDMEDCKDKLNEQQEKITELEIELTDCKNRKEQLEYKNTKLIAKIDFLERVIDGDV